MFVDIHVIQSVPRAISTGDDTGSPKTAYHGAYCAHASVARPGRRPCGSFAGAIDQSKLGIRTKQALRSSRIA